MGNDVIQFENLYKEEIQTKEKINQEALTLYDKANLLPVTTIEEHRFATDFYEGIRQLKKKVDAAFDPIIKKANESHQEAIKQKKIQLEPIEKAESLLKGKINVFIQEEKKRCDEALALLEAKKKEQKVIIEAQRIAAAEAAEARGACPETVDAILDFKPPVVIEKPPEMVKFDGRVFGKTKIEFKVVNFDLIPSEFLKVDESKVKAQIKITGRDTKIAGITVFEVNDTF